MKPRLLLALLVTSLAFVSFAYAATPPSTVHQGGTGWNGFTAGTIPIGPGTGLSALRFATSSAFTYSTSTNTLTVTNVTVTGTCTGCGATSPAGSSGQLQYNASGAFGAVASTSATINNGLTGTLTTIGSGQTIGLATINAGVLGAVTNGVVPTSLATSTLYGLGTNGYVLAEVGGVPTWVATSSIQNLSLTTTGSSGAATLVGTTLNIPQYTGGGGGTGLATTTPWSGSGLAYRVSDAAVSTVATSSLTISGPFTVPASTSIVGSGGGVTYWGLATTSQPSSSNLLVSNGGAGVYPVATSTLTAGTGLTGSFTQVGSGGTLALSVPVSTANGGTGTTTWYTGGLAFYNNLGYLSQAATQKDLYWDIINSKLGLGTTTPWAMLSINPNGTAGPEFAIGSSSATHFVVTNGGNVGIGTSTPYKTLSVAGGGVFSSGIKVGTTSDPGGGADTSVLIRAIGWDNSTNGIQTGVSNLSAGTSAYACQYLNNNLADLTVTHFGALCLNGGNYADPSFGTGLANKNQLILQGTDGLVSIISSTSTEALNPAGVEILTGGVASGPEGNQRFKIAVNGTAGFGSSTPHAQLSVNAGSASPTRNLFELSYSTGSGNGATTTVATVASSSAAAAGLNVGSTTITAAAPVALIQGYAAVASTTNALFESVTGGACIIMKDVSGTGYTQLYTQAGALSAKVHTGSLATCN